MAVVEVEDSAVGLGTGNVPHHLVAITTLRGAVTATAVTNPNPTALEMKTEVSDLSYQCLPYTQTTFF